ncbi:MAG: stage II sporulation protein P [Bacillota bacterium]|jgi:stage II sporulation protein P
MNKGGFSYAKKNKSQKAYAYVISLLVIFIILFGICNLLHHEALLHTLVGENGQRIVISTLPFSVSSEKQEGVVASFLHKVSSPSYFFSASAGAFADSLPTSAEPETNLPPLEVPIIPTNDQDLQAADLTSEPLVGIYCTHSAESYIPTSGQSSTAGKNGGVYQVAKSLQQGLKENGISAVLCDTIHDYPKWQLSYQNSLASMKRMKEKYPSIKMFIDVHRDSAIENVSTVTEINGEKVAKIMLVVGSNKRLKHDRWQENLAFAQKIGKKTEEMYPGILRGVRVQSGRYNQHFSTQAILIEMGSNENSRQQAQKTAYLFANVVSQILRQGE